MAAHRQPPRLPGRLLLGLFGALLTVVGVAFGFAHDSPFLVVPVFVTGAALVFTACGVKL